MGICGNLEYGPKNGRVSLRRDWGTLPQYPYNNEKMANDVCHVCVCLEAKLLKKKSRTNRCSSEQQRSLHRVFCPMGLDIN